MVHLPCFHRTPSRCTDAFNFRTEPPIDDGPQSNVHTEHTERTSPRPSNVCSLVDARFVSCVLHILSWSEAHINGIDQHDIQPFFRPRPAACPRRQLAGDTSCARPCASPSVLVADSPDSEYEPPAVGDSGQLTWNEACWTHNDEQYHSRTACATTARERSRSKEKVFLHGMQQRLRAQV